MPVFMVLSLWLCSNEHLLWSNTERS